MKICGLDLSTTSTGLCIMENKKIVHLQKIKPKTTLETIDKIIYVTKEIEKVLNQFKVEKVIVEDIFLGKFFGFSQVLGFASLARLSGAVIFMIKDKFNLDSQLIKAISARPLVGVKGNAQKAEIQEWCLKTFKMCDDEKIVEYQGLIDAVYAKKNVGDIEKKEFKKRMELISKHIEEEQGLGEDCADAILLSYGGK